jgi:hypothetical protein
MKTVTVEEVSKALKKTAWDANAVSNPGNPINVCYPNEVLIELFGEELAKEYWVPEEQHLKELRDIGLIHGEIDGLKINYCLCCSSISEKLLLFETFFAQIKDKQINCNPTP